MYWIIGSASRCASHQPQSWRCRSPSVKYSDCLKEGAVESGGGSADALVPSARQHGVKKPIRGVGGMRCLLKEASVFGSETLMIFYSCLHNLLEGFAVWNCVIPRPDGMAAGQDALDCPFCVRRKLAKNIGWILPLGLDCQNLQQQSPFLHALRLNWKPVGCAVMNRLYRYLGLSDFETWPRLQP